MNMTFFGTDADHAQVWRWLADGEYQRAQDS